MKIKRSLVTKFELSELDRLDPVQIIAEDLGPGRGKITLSCYGLSWTNYWAGMGDQTIIEFVSTCHRDYLAQKLSSGFKYEIDWDRVNEEVIGPDPGFFDDTIDATTASEYEDQLTAVYGPDWRMDLPERKTYDYEYLCRVIEAMQAGFKQLTEEAS